jgi:hypothetical protein
MVSGGGSVIHMRCVYSHICFYCDMMRNYVLVCCGHHITGVVRGGQQGQMEASHNAPPSDVDFVHGT